MRACRSLIAIWLLILSTDMGYPCDWALWREVLALDSLSFSLLYESLDHRFHWTSSMNLLWCPPTVCWNDFHLMLNIGGCIIVSSCSGLFMCSGFEHGHVQCIYVATSAPSASTTAPAGNQYGWWANSITVGLPWLPTYW